MTKNQKGFFSVNYGILWWTWRAKNIVQSSTVNIAVDSHVSMHSSYLPKPLSSRLTPTKNKDCSYDIPSCRTQKQVNIILLRNNSKLKWTASRACGGRHTELLPVQANLPFEKLNSIPSPSPYPFTYLPNCPHTPPHHHHHHQPNTTIMPYPLKK